mgnify:CR=1 FL=1
MARCFGDCNAHQHNIPDLRLFDFFRLASPGLSLSVAVEAVVEEVEEEFWEGDPLGRSREGRSGAEIRGVLL